MDRNRRAFLQTGLLSVAWVGTASSSVFAQDAAKPIRIGILIPGSKADHGWMESAYNGMKAAEQRHGNKVKITYIENVKFADMEQALVTLASKNDMVIGAAGQTQASVLKVAKRFPKVKFSIVGPTGQPTANVAQYDVLQAQIGFVAGAVAAMMSKTGAVSYVGGLEIPAIVNLGLRGMEQAAREKGTKMIGSYSNYCSDNNPLYIAYTVSGIGFMVEYAIDQIVAGTWHPEYKPFGLVMGPRAAGINICTGATPEILAKVKELEADLLSGKIKVKVG